MALSRLFRWAGSPAAPSVVRYAGSRSVSLCGAAYCPDSMAMYVVTAVNRLGKSSGLSPFALTMPDWVTNMWVDTVNKVVTWSPSRSGNIANYRVFEGHQGSWEDPTDPSGW